MLLCSLSPASVSVISCWPGFGGMTGIAFGYACASMHAVSFTNLEFVAYMHTSLYLSLSFTVYFLISVIFRTHL